MNKHTKIRNLTYTNTLKTHKWSYTDEMIKHKWYQTYTSIQEDMIYKTRNLIYKTKHINLIQYITLVGATLSLSHLLIKEKKIKGFQIFTSMDRSKKEGGNRSEKLGFWKTRRVVTLGFLEMTAPRQRRRGTDGWNPKQRRISHQICSNPKKTAETEPLRCVTNPCVIRTRAFIGAAASTNPRYLAIFVRLHACRIVNIVEKWQFLSADVVIKQINLIGLNDGGFVVHRT